jgi:hypothetical protein
MRILLKKRDTSDSMTARFTVSVGVLAGLLLFGAQAGALAQNEGCLEMGGGLLQVSLSGAVQYDIEWDNEDMDCGGFGSSDMIVVDGEMRTVPFQSVQIGGVVTGTGNHVDLFFNIQVPEGETGADLPTKVGMNDRASGRNYATQAWDGCSTTVTEQTPIQENPAFRSYRLVAIGSCSAPSVQYAGPGGVGASEVTVGDFELTAVAVWMGPRQ